MQKSNLKNDEVKTIVSTLIVKGGIDTGISGLVPGYLINKMEDVLEEIIDWQNRNVKGE